MTTSLSPYFVLIHLMPCNCGSIISGQRSAFDRMVAFSADILSLGRPSLHQLAIWASSVSKLIGSRFSDIGIGSLSCLRYGTQCLSIKSRRYCLVKQPTYEMNAVTSKTSPGIVSPCIRRVATDCAHRIFSEASPPTSRLANSIVLLVKSASCQATNNRHQTPFEIDMERIKNSRAVPDHKFTGYQPDSEFKIRPDPDIGYRIPISESDCVKNRNSLIYIILT